MNEKWFELSAAQVEKKLKTNAASGLSRKAARSRVNPNVGSVFVIPTRSPIRLLGELVSDFALLLLFFVALISLFFEEYQTGITVLVLLFAQVVVAWILYYRSHRTVESLSSFFYPTARVIRGGKLFYVDFRSVVPGDVILVEEGDILCCDARLVNSDGLKVRMRVDRDQYMALDKMASAFVRAGENRAYEMANMLHAGSVVLAGSGRAIVTAVGKYTYLGAMTGGIALPMGKRVPSTVVSLRKICSRINMISLLAVLPLSLISLLFSYKNGGTILLSSAFLTALALAATTMSQLMCSLCTLFYTTMIRRIAVRRNGMIIRSVEALEKIEDADYLFLLDGSVLTDGLLHFQSAYLAEGEIRNFSASTEGTVLLSELVSLYHDAATRTLTTGLSGGGGFSRGIEGYMEKCGVDRNALRIRCSTISYAPGNLLDTPERLDYMDQGERYCLQVWRTPKVIQGCREVFLGGERQSLSEEGKRELERFLDRCAQNYLSPIIFTQSKGRDGALCFVGILLLREGIDRNWEQSIKKLERCGCKVIAFSKSEADVSNIPSQLLARGLVSKDQFLQRHTPLTYGFGSIRAYADFEDEDIAVLLQHAKKQGKRVVIVGAGENAAELAARSCGLISCAPILTRIGGYLDEEIQTVDRLGQPSRLSCAQTVKQKADCLVSRPTANGGGLSAIALAFSQIKRIRDRLSQFLRYWICIQLIRVVAVSIPMLFGKAILDARHVLLFCGIYDTVSLLGALFAPSATQEKERKNFCAVRTIRAYFLEDKGMWIAALTSCITAVLLPELFGFFAIGGRYYEKVEVLFLSLLLVQLFASVLIKHGTRLSTLKHALRDRFLLLQAVLSLLFSVLCFAWESFGNLFDIEAFPSIPYSLLIPIPAIAFCLLFILLTNRLQSKKSD